MLMSGGSRGFGLSINTAIIAATALFLLVVWLRLLSRRGVIVTAAWRLLLLGVGVLIIPLLYTQDNWAAEASWRILGLLAGIVVYFSCLQIRFTHRTLHKVLAIVLLLVAVQALLALLQLFVPALAWVPLYGQRVYGTFRQPNVLASFIATGQALVLMLLLLPGFALGRVWHERCRLTGLALVLGGLAALLIWIQSRAGWVGGGVVALLFLWRFGRAFPARSKVACGAMLSGVVLGVGWFADVAGEPISHVGSNHARWTMLRDTLAMIVEKPFLGWGYGGFEYSFQHFRINQTPPTLVTEITRHPHNEILLWVAEGGVVGLVGVVLILAAGLRVIHQAIHYDRLAFATGRRMAGLPTALCIALLPIAIHTQLEYPFYLSALHFVVLLLLLAMADRLSGGVQQRQVLPAKTGVMVAGGMALLALAVAVVMGFALKGNLALAEVERFGMADVKPLEEMPAPSRWLHQERVVFDEQVNALLTYNDTRDERLLENYRQWAKAYLGRRIDKNVYANLIQILQHQGHVMQAEQFRQDAMRLFPTDARFQTKNNLPAASVAENKEIQ
ncbi:Wzy polymerase domain-containing protein [Serratia sp. 2723]|uniref:PglL family O-oligosaccharyltransferase n=1 Tax=unclassified Serratia (in: enterobacteria) TaxID=2647522 RepID=UPI003D1B74DF